MFWLNIVLTAIDILFVVWFCIALKNDDGGSYRKLRLWGLPYMVVLLALLCFVEPKTTILLSLGFIAVLELWYYGFGLCFVATLIKKIKARKKNKR